MKFYRRDPDRAIAGMAELSLQERGAYNTIIDALYARDGFLPDDDTMLRRIMGCHGNEWRAVKARLIEKKKIWIEDGFIHARGVDETLDDAAKFSEIQRERAEKRWETSGKRPRNFKEKSEKPNKNNETPMPSTATVTSIYAASLESKICNIFGLELGCLPRPWLTLHEQIAEWRSYDLTDAEIEAVINRIAARGARPAGPSYFTPALHDAACEKAGLPKIPMTKMRKMPT